MKQRLKVITVAMTALGLTGSLMANVYAKSGDETVLYLVNEDSADADLLSRALDDGPTTLPATPAPKPPKNLDDFLERPVMTAKQKRVYDISLREQQEFLNAVEGFLTSAFNVADDKAEIAFIQARDRIVQLTFAAPDLRNYYQRLYLINDSYRLHPLEKARFVSLDGALRTEWMRLEEKRRRIRSIMMTSGAIISAGLFGVASYATSTKVIPILDSDKGLTYLTKLAGRGGMVVVGAGVGAALGRYAGFLASDFLVRYQRDFFDPIDGVEDLYELLDMIDEI